MPEMLKAQQEFGPQFTEEEIKILEKFGPRFGEASREAQRAISPESIAGQDRVLGFLEEDALLSPSETEQFRADSRAATSARGLGESGFGALEEVRGLTALRNQLKMQQINVALSAAGRTPTISQIGGISSGMSSGRLIEGVTPSQLFGRAESMGQLGFQQQQLQAQQKSSGIGAMGSILGAAIG